MVIGDETDWSGLFHALGPADDLPAILAALRGTDPDAAGVAFTALWPRVFAGGRLTPATPPVVRHLVSVLHDPALGAGDHTIRPGVLFLLREVARVTADAEVRHRAAVDGTVQDWLAGHLASPDPPAVHEWSDGDRPGQVLLHNAIVDSFDLLPQIFAAVWPIPVHWPAPTRVMAAAATAMLVRHPELADRRAEVIAYHQETARQTADRHDCAGLVLGLGELGVAPTDWLDDPRLAVRTCAALAPALADEAEVLLRAAEHPRAFDHSFTEPFVAPAYRMMCPPQLQEGPRRVLIRTVCERVGDFPRLLAAASAAVDLGGALRPAAEFAPYLRHAFPSGLPTPGTASAQQSRFAALVVRRDDLWDGTRPGVAETLAASGLPYDRDRWQQVTTPVALDAAGRPTYDGAGIVVLTPPRFLRERPEWWIGVARTDPVLPRRLLSLVIDDGLRVTVEGPLTFSAQVSGGDAARLDAQRIIGEFRVDPLCWYGVPMAAALSLWVSVYQWHAGVAARQQFVDGVAAGPREVLGPADHADGCCIVFELDPEWIPPGVRLPG
ncbi:hypothetical protein AB0B66_30530 [Catellatospora sp. NPDC049111]|uniref:hypothetical protein n=1 Tax=Catellatospora sp. NPDC049111 TaxID=3155271 RepID=UPI00340C1D53